MRRDGAQRNNPCIEEALVLPLLPFPWCPHLEKQEVRILIITQTIE